MIRNYDYIADKCPGGTFWLHAFKMIYSGPGPGGLGKERRLVGNRTPPSEQRRRLVEPVAIGRERSRSQPGVLVSLVPVVLFDRFPHPWKSLDSVPRIQSRRVDQMFVPVASRQTVGVQQCPFHPPQQFVQFPALRRAQLRSARPEFLVEVVVSLRTLFQPRRHVV